MTQHDRRGGPNPQGGGVDGVAPIPPLDILAMLRVVWHGKWMIISAIMLMTGLAGYYAFRMASPQYMATATLQLDGPSSPLSDVQQQSYVDDAALNTQVSLVTSDPVLTNVIAKLDLLSDPEFNRYLVPSRPLALRTLRTRVRHFLAGTSELPPDPMAILEKTVQNLRRTLAVARQPDTYILNITARSGDPDKAALLANTTAALFLAHVETLQMQARTEAEVWLQSRVDDLRKQLETQQMQVAALIATAQIQQDRSLDTLSAQVLAADQGLIEARNTLALLEIAPDSGSTRKRAEIAQMTDRIAALAGLKDRLSAQLSTQSAGLAQLHQIQLQVDATRQLYQTFLGRLHDNRLQQGMNTPNAQRIAPAANGAYIGPHKIQILTIAAMLGGTLGVMLVAVLHQMRKGVVDARSLRDATGLPVLVQLSSRALRRFQKGPRAFPLPAGSDLSLATSSLQMTLSLITRGQPAQVILATASIHGEGKTQNAILLAHGLANARKRVVLIATDGNAPLFRSVVGREVYADAQESWGSGQCDVHSPSLGTDILAIPTTGDPAEPPFADHFAAMLKTLRASYDHIIIDGPPVLHDPKARVIAHHCDAIIYAVQWSKTPLDVVQRGLSELEDIGCPATGLTLSKINLRKMRKLSNDPCVHAVQAAQAM